MARSPKRHFQWDEGSTSLAPEKMLIKDKDLQVPCPLLITWSGYLPRAPYSGLAKLFGEME
jgi:hypothetical protein